MTSLSNSGAKITVEGISIDKIVDALGIRGQVLSVQLRWREGRDTFDGPTKQLPGCTIFRYGHSTVECTSTEDAVRELRKILREREREVVKSNTARNV